MIQIQEIGHYMLTKKKFDELVKNGKPFIVTANSPKGANYLTIDGWDCKEITKECLKFLCSVLKCDYVGCINLPSGITIICDEDGLNKQLEPNDFATSLMRSEGFDNYGLPIVGDAVIAFPPKEK